MHGVIWRFGPASDGEDGLAQVWSIRKLFDLNQIRFEKVKIVVLLITEVSLNFLKTLWADTVYVSGPKTIVRMLLNGLVLHDFVCHNR